MIVFEKIYDGESIADIGRDIEEMIDVRFNENIKDIPVDQFGIQQGHFKIVVEWANE